MAEETKNNPYAFRIVQYQVILAEGDVVTLIQRELAGGEPPPQFVPWCYVLHINAAVNVKGLPEPIPINAQVEVPLHGCACVADAFTLIVASRASVETKALADSVVKRQVDGILAQLNQQARRIQPVPLIPPSGIISDPRLNRHRKH